MKNVYTSSILRCICILCALLWLQACGLQPVYATRDAGSGEASSSTSDRLRSVQILVSKSREGQMFRTALEDRMAPGGTRQIAYELEPGLNIRLEPLSIETDGTTRRYRLIGSSRFSLRELSSGNIVLQDHIERFSSYNIADSDFSTYVSSQDAKQQLIESLADDIRFRLMRYFMKQQDMATSSPQIEG